MSLLIRTSYDVVEALMLFIASWHHFLFSPFCGINRPEKFLCRRGSNAIANLIFRNSRYTLQPHYRDEARFRLLATSEELYRVKRDSFDHKFLREMRHVLCAWRGSDMLQILNSVRAPPPREPYGNGINRCHWQLEAIIVIE